ncbi:pyroglutamyl-peptidase [Aureococcus anophagefferens]|nr:pyroglutamyl-peptidase [Aureococcus anophagefferens]
MPRVHWTGFGKFHGVADNPSATLAERVAANDADVVIHLGVAVDYANITLERCAYNDATFRCDDERGWRPAGEKISADSPFGAPSPTPLDVEAAAAKAKDLGFSVDVSDDAGRFVCNYLYYCSLRAAPLRVRPRAVLRQTRPRGPARDAGGPAERPARRGGGGRRAAAARAAESTADEVVEDLVAMGIDAAMARQAAAAGCTSVETAMEFIFSEPPAMPPPPPSAQRLKQVLVVRADLGMSAGKIAAQCAHASLGGYREALRRTPDVADRWVGAGETVIVVQHDGCLRSLHAAAVAANLNTSLIADAGRTEVAPGTDTVLGVGPAPADDVDAITGRLKLLS